MVKARVFREPSSVSTRSFRSHEEIYFRIGDWVETSVATFLSLPYDQEKKLFRTGFFFFSKRNSLFINLPVKKKSTSESDNIFVRVILAKPSIRSGAKQTDRLGPLANSFNGQTRIRLRGYAPQISNLYALSLQCYLLSIYETKIS